MAAQDYAVTTPYGQVAGYPLNGGFHMGIDYGAPEGTPVVVNGVVIGLSGATGYATGAHLHVGRWVGGTVTNPGVGGGFHFNSAKVTEIHTVNDGANGKYVRIQGDGASWVYLHLSQVKVSVGQVLQGGEEVIPDQDNYFARYSKTFKAIRGRNPSREEFRLNGVGLTWLKVLEILEDNSEADNAAQAQNVGQLAIQDQWQNQIYGLQAQLKTTNDKLAQVASEADLKAKLQKQVDDLTAKNQALIDQQAKDEEAGKNWFRALGKLIGLIK